MTMERLFGGDPSLFAPSDVVVDDILKVLVEGFHRSSFESQGIFDVCDLSLKDQSGFIEIEFAAVALVFHRIRQ